VVWTMKHAEKTPHSAFISCAWYKYRQYRMPRNVSDKVQHLRKTCLITKTLFRYAFIRRNEPDSVRPAFSVTRIKSVAGSILPLIEFLFCIYQRGPTGGLRATSGPRSLVTRPAKSFVTSYYELIYFLYTEGFEKRS
jgi:hypothetical protein